MDKNTFAGLFLILLILVGSSYLIKPAKEAEQTEASIQDTINQKKAADKQSIVFADSIKRKDAQDSTYATGPFSSPGQGGDKIVVLENQHLKVNLSGKGGRIESVELKGQKTYDNKPLILFNKESSNFGLQFTVGDKSIKTDDLFFQPSADGLSVSKTDSGSLTMRLTYADKQYIDYVYSLKGSDYKVGLTITAHGLQNVISPSKPMILNWGATLFQKEKDNASEQRYSGAYFKEGASVDHIGSTKDERKEVGNDGKVQWVSFKQHFFSNVLISKKGFDKADLSVSLPGKPGVIKTFTASMHLPAVNGQAVSYPLEFYFGPNKFKTLKDQGYDLERQVDLGWGPLKWINRVAVIPVFSVLERLGWSYGIIILTLTVLLKLILFPLTYKSYLSMAKMRVLKPEMDQIKAKVGEDNPTLLQQEYLKLYKKAGVNPLGGCIPMLLQLPIIMAFFFFFPNLFELRQESFLWMKDLSTYDSVINFAKIPLLNVDHISAMCLLMTVSTLIITYFNNQTSGVTGQMKYIGYITPIIFLGVLNSYPSGLNYYYFCANILTFIQQFLIRQWVNDDKIHARIQENKKKPDTAKKKSKFQQRMDEYMRQQQAIQAKKSK